MVLKFFRVSDDFMMQKVYVLRLMSVCVGLIMVSRLFLSFLIITMEYNWSWIKVDWLAACITLRVVGAVFVVIGSKARYLKKSTKCCWPIRSKETWVKYTPLTCSANANSHYQEKNTYCVIKSLERLKN